jgi:WXG100 family type VII secretion target
MRADTVQHDSEQLMEMSAKFGQILDDLQGSYNRVWKLIDDIDGHWLGEAATDFETEAYDVDKNWGRVLNALQEGRDGTVNIARILDAGIEQAAAVQRKK